MKIEPAALVSLREKFAANKRTGSLIYVTKEELPYMSELGRDPLLEERQKTHGDFKTNARISQKLKHIFSSEAASQMSSVHNEALDMIALKLSRILSGQANFKDHWDDIAGYAKLGSEACDK